MSEEKRKYNNFLMLLLVLILVLVGWNVYWECIQYYAYRRNLAGGNVRREKYMTSQTSYFLPDPYFTDQLLIDIIADKDVTVYGEYTDLTPVFDYFAKSVEYRNQAVDYSALQEYRWELDMGTFYASGFYTMTEMTQETGNHLNELRILNDAGFYMSGSEIADASEIVCAIDDKMNLYIMTEEESARFTDE